MIKYYCRFVIPLLFSALFTSAQESTFPANGVASKNNLYYALTNAKIFLDYQTVLEKGTLLIRNGIVEQVGADVSIPKGAVVMDMKGKYIYPSFIDLYTSYGLPEPKKMGGGGGPQMDNASKGALNWNQAIKPELDAARLFNTDEKAAEELRKLGFGTVCSFNRDGIVRGTSLLVTLSDEKENNIVLDGKVSANYSFDKGTSTQEYPSSLMGSIALIRQTYYDAQWYKICPETKREFNISLEAFNNNRNLPQIFEVKNKLNVLRADKIGDEFKTQYIIKGSGDEYQRINDMKASGADFIIPLNFPATLDVEDAYNALEVSLEEMKHWELAPTNPAALEKNNIRFAFTTSDLKDKKDFWSNLRKAIEMGLSEREALKALTFSPAQLIGKQQKIGALKPGMYANFIVTSGNVFDKKNILYENWIQGKPFRINNFDQTDIRNNYTLSFNDKNLELKISGEIDAPKASIMADTIKVKTNLTISGSLISINFEWKEEGTYRLSGTYINKDKFSLEGSGKTPSGISFNWTAVYKSDFDKVKDEEKKDSTKNKIELGSVSYPMMAYGWNELPKQENILIKNATVWTNEKDGILNNADVLVQNGKIQQVAKGITAYPTDTRIIDGTGKHITPGIIDEHSHIAISNGVNEGTQAVSAEVRIGDVVNSDDINIYRQLAGGVTAAQLLHGSANPIGGQSALIKLRWGKTPEQMKIENADGFIKCALGENVKQANWGDDYRIRFPQTRMGVEQTFTDAFTRARDYEKRLNSVTPLNPVRRDLELDCLLEILNKERFITCHSYVQSEVNMLMHVADSFGFKVNTFTHILEGYKVADKMKKHGVAGSTFSDWWAYKVEVQDAIPYNGSLMNAMGVVTAFNSDDAEMARRLNQEAGKAVKYGNTSEEEALKFVTLNPAKMLHLDDKMGSIKVGKDADLVVWSDNPLSVYAKAEKTVVDGIVYFDSERDKMLREADNKERARLIQKMIRSKANGDKTEMPTPKKKALYHCDTLQSEEEMHAY